MKERSSADTAAPSSVQEVRKRHVFYIPGYDPFHPRRYRELYRKESRLQAEISGYQIKLHARQGAKSYGWGVQSNINGQDTAAEVEVLVWSDIVRDSMSTSIVATYVQLVATAWRYIGSGALFRLMKLRKGPVIAALYPVVFLLAQLLFSVGLGLFVAWGADLGLKAIGLAETRNLSLILVPLVMLPVLRWFKTHDNKIFAHYLMHDYAHSAQHGGAYPAELENRLKQFKDQIATALQSEVDEVLVVGHSSGAYLGVSVLADLIRANGVPPEGPCLGFLSLGQVVPMVSFLPNADRLRGDLQYLSERDELIWVDVTAPGDGCAFALCDPVAVSGVAREGQKWPIVFSAAFTQSLSPARWKELKRRYFRLHFQYLCAFDRPKDYDYFQITAGPRTLKSRYEGRKQSISRIRRAVSKFTSVRTS